MKKTSNIIIAALALLLIVPFAFAVGDTKDLQVGPDYIDNGSGICYNKTAESTTDGSGIYWITLESFAKGGGVKVNETIPSDIVLVLDLSTSMNSSFGSSYVGETQAWSYSNSYGNYGNNLYYKYEDSYYQLHYDTRNSRVRVYFTVQGTSYYLTPQGIQASPTPNRVNYNTTFYNGTLYTSKDLTRMDALKEAVYAFIDMIDENDQQGPNNTRVGNKIAIVTFAKNGIIEQSLSDFSTVSAAQMKSTVEDLEAEGGTMANRGMQKAYDILSNPSVSVNKLKTVVFFTDGDPGQYGCWDRTYDGWNGSTLNDYALGGDPYRYQNTWKCANETIRIANEIKGLAVSSTDPALEVTSNVFTVSIIPDNIKSDYTDVYLGKTSSNYLNATNMGPGATSDPAIPNDYGYIRDWLGGNQIWSNGNGTRNASSTNFALTANTVSDLIKAFKYVAGESGSSSRPMSEKSVSQVDVVSASFMLPPDADTDNILIYVAKCEGREYNKTYYTDKTKQETATGTFYTFGEEVSKDDCTDTFTRKVLDDEGHETGETETVRVTGNVHAVLSASGTYPSDPEKLDVITVTGFDYGNLYVGPVLKQGVSMDDLADPDDIESATEDQIDSYHGYKLIVKIPIMMDTNAVGGPNVETNGPGSGITVDGERLVTFDSPTVSLPINLHINKQGLHEGESAKFTIYQALKPDWPEDNYPVNSLDSRYDLLEWTPVSTVFVTQHEGQAADAAITKVTGMPSVNESGQELVYRIVEDNWSWSYDPTVPSISTSDQLVVNPFVFENEKIGMIDVTVRHAESKATNTFRNESFIVGGKTYKAVNSDHVSYDDSKENGR